MDKAKQELFDSYEQLVLVQRMQLLIATKEKYDEQIDDIRELDRQTIVPKASINRIRMEDQLYNDIVVNNRVEITAYILEMQAINAQLQHIFNEWYSEASNEMQQVSVHRKTLQTYGGVNYSDTVSYYFDEKK
jgi:hypothetical protein